MRVIRAINVDDYREREQLPLATAAKPHEAATLMLPSAHGRDLVSRPIVPNSAACDPATTDADGVTGQLTKVCSQRSSALSNLRKSLFYRSVEFIACLLMLCLFLNEKEGQEEVKSCFFFFMASEF